MTELLVSDLFCGAGGTSTGAEQAVKELGHTMTLTCVNHWPVAIETHQKNHPTARHYVEDVSVADPEELVPEGYLDLLMASPECRFYSRARGGKPVHDQGRMNPWAVHRWLTSLKVKCLLVENVPEFVDWGPLLEDGRPDPKHKGEYFQSWFLSLQKMGYKAEWRMLNAADHGDATTRIRFFLIARNDGRPIKWPEPSHSVNGDGNMLGHRQKWRAARDHRLAGCRPFSVRRSEVQKEAAQRQDHLQDSQGAREVRRPARPAVCQPARNGPAQWERRRCGALHRQPAWRERV